MANPVNQLAMACYGIGKLLLPSLMVFLVDTDINRGLAYITANKDIRLHESLRFVT